MQFTMVRLWSSAEAANSDSEHTGFGPLDVHTVSPNATHANGVAELDVHSLFGHMGAKATFNAVRAINEGKRPFIISRSTFPSSGKYTGHWVSFPELKTGFSA